MDFPKAPKREVKGSLKLYVKSPKVEVEVSEEPEPETDYAGSLTFRPPAGFFIEDDITPSIHRQKEAALQRLSEFQGKLEYCGSCREQYNEAGVSLATQVVEKSVEFFLGVDLEKPVSIVVAQQVLSGEIKISFSNDIDTVSMAFGKETSKSLTAEEINELEGLLKCLTKNTTSR